MFTQTRIGQRTGTDWDESGGDNCLRQQCSARNLHENRFGKGAPFFNQRVVDSRKRIVRRSSSLVSEDTMLNWADVGTKAHTSERLTSLLRQMPLRLKMRQTMALACLMLLDQEHRASHGGGWRTS